MNFVSMHVEGEGEGERERWRSGLDDLWSPFQPYVTGREAVKNENLIVESSLIL